MKNKEHSSRQLKKDFVDLMVDLDPKYHGIINERFWDLMNDDNTRDEENARRKQRVNS